MTPSADLHIHTFYSDSTASPEEVVEEAVQAGLSAIAITDHDTVDGVEPTRLAAQGRGLEVLTGIELSAEKDGKDIHILGYLFDVNGSPLVRRVAEFQDTRVRRIELMLEKLQAVGVNNITLEEVCARTKSRSVGRPHLASLLVEKGWVKDMKTAFLRYLSEDAPGYVPKHKITPVEAIELIHASGGVAVMAHPVATNRDELIPSMVRAGLDGIEVYYPNIPRAAIEYYEGIARKHHLIMTGGSDAHGKAKVYTRIGKSWVNCSAVEEMKVRAKRGAGV